MTRFHTWPLLLSLLLTHPLAAQESPTKRSPQTRQDLWEALEKSLPEEVRDIDVYAENDSLTRVLFRSQEMTFMFSTETGKVTHQDHQKFLRRVNRITYVPGKFILWYNGRAESTIGTE